MNVTFLWITCTRTSDFFSISLQTDSHQKYRLFSSKRMGARVTLVRAHFSLSRSRIFFSTFSPHFASFSGPIQAHPSPKTAISHLKATRNERKSRSEKWERKLGEKSFFLVPLHFLFKNSVWGPLTKFSWHSKSLIISEQRRPTTFFARGICSHLQGLLISPGWLSGFPTLPDLWPGSKSTTSFSMIAIRKKIWLLWTAKCMLSFSSTLL